jgi:L-2,4-diaminobutyrate decarboxylase
MLHLPEMNWAPRILDTRSTMSVYRELLESLRQAFPAPVSDPVHDGYVVFSLLRALDQVDALKSQAPVLGSPRDPDYATARQARLAESGKTTEEVIPELVNCLRGMLIWGHPRSQVNVTAHPSIASIIGVVLPSMYNPNLCSDESGRGFSEAEVRVASMTAALVGYDAKACGGLFTFGGTGTLLYGVKIGLEKALPGCLREGLRRPAVVLASDQSHYACLNVAGWLGIGQENVVHVPTQPDNAIDLDALEAAFRQAIAEGKRIAAIVATMGTTDAFGIDNLEAIDPLRRRLAEELKLDYLPHLHADAVIGWAWSVFTDYDFRGNPLGFRGRTLRALAGAASRIRYLSLADSLGVDFHKTGFAPYISSLFLIRAADDFRHVVRSRDTMPYLFHSGQYHPAMYSLETTRAGTGPTAALANLLLLGRRGMQALLGHSVEMAEFFRELIAAQPELTVLNDKNFGPVTLFRAYPTGVDTFTVKDRETGDPDFRGKLASYNEFNRRIYRRVHAEALTGRGVAIGLTDCYRRSEQGEQIAALKSYVLSPFVDEGRMPEIISHVLEARAAVEAEGDWTKGTEG